MRFLHIKRAYVVDPTYIYEVDRDVASNMLLLEKVYGKDSSHDMCAITEDGEWLMHGRKIDPTALLQLYSIVFVYIHSPSDTYDRAFHMCKAHAQKYLFIYKATDAVLHHAERFAAFVKTHQLKVKIAHQVHIDMNEHNAQYTSSEVVAGKHIRSVFLPVDVIPSLYRTFVPSMHNHLRAHTYEELSAHIDALRHDNSNITLRSHVIGDSVFVVSIPKMRGEKIYITMPLGSVHFHKPHLSDSIKKEIHQVVSDVSHVLFAKTPVVYTLRIHSKRGVFVQGTSPFYFFVLHNHDFLLELSLSHGIPVADLFLSML